MGNLIHIDSQDLKDGIYREINLLQLPITFPYHNANKDRIELTMKTVRGLQRLEVSYSVGWNTRYGIPGPGIKSIMNGVEKIARNSGYPIMNPIRFSLYELTNILGLDEGGATNKYLMNGLKLLHSMTITAKEAFYNNMEHEWSEVDDHIIEKITWKGKRLPDGSLAETNYLFFSEWFINSLNAKYNFIIDEEYALSLMDIPLSNRLYELLCLSFYKCHIQGKEYARVKYSDLCMLTQAERQKYKSKAMERLEKSLKRLVSSGFIEEATWEDVPVKRIEDNMKDWLITFWPGPRAMEVVKANVRTAPEVPGKMLALEGLEHSEGFSPPPLPPERAKAYEAMIRKGVSKSVAKRLAQDYASQVVLDCCAASDYVDIKKSRGAYIAKLIENFEEWGLPEQFLKERDKQEATNKKEASARSTTKLYAKKEKADEDERAVAEALNLFRALEPDEQKQRLTNAISESFIFNTKKNKFLKMLDEIIGAINSKTHSAEVPASLSLPDWIFVEQEIITMMKTAQEDSNPTR